MIRVLSLTGGRVHPFLGRPAITWMAALLAVAVSATCTATAEDEGTLPWIQAYLEEFSVVLDSDPDRGREYFATQLSVPEGQDALVLVYERTRYGDAKATDADSRQRIHYTFALADVDPATIKVRSSNAPLSESPFYMVLIQVTEAKGYVDYSNIVEERLQDGSVDVTSSRGKARTLALGYFSSEENARRLAKATESLLNTARDKKTVDR